MVQMNARLGGFSGWQRSPHERSDMRGRDFKIIPNVASLIGHARCSDECD
jgi:hypothetical protein